MRYKIIFTLILCLVGVMAILLSKIPVLKGTSFDSKELPFQKLYIVKPGDTLLSIGEKYGVNITTLAAVNEISDCNLIETGQLIDISGEFITTCVAGNENLTKITVGQMSWPAVGWISSPFGWRDGCVHEGLDIAAGEGEPVYAARGGRVIFAGPRGTYGLTVIIDHGAGLTTLYAHASSLLVQENDWVKEGQLIAGVGNTGHSNGPHLHFEVRLNEVPYDPQYFLSRISA